MTGIINRRRRKESLTFFRVASIALLILLTACAGYRAGPVNGQPPGARAVIVKIFQNQTHEPRLSESVAFALRRKLQQDGTYRLDTKNAGDIILDGTITRFDRTPLSFDPSDILTTRDYALSISAEIIATERTSGKVVLQKTFYGKTTVRATPNRDAAERQAHPTIAEDLARNITSALTEGPW
jgi:hypothetical protein